MFIVIFPTLIPLSDHSRFIPERIAETFKIFLQNIGDQMTMGLPPSHALFLIARSLKSGCLGTIITLRVSSFPYPYPYPLSLSGVSTTCFHYVVIKFRQLFLRPAACLTSTLLETGVDTNDCKCSQD
jgi:hypothetical protein